MQSDSNIDEQILAALMQIFQKELQQERQGDPLALRVLRQMDLQDDPTLSAPYLVFGQAGGEEEAIRLPTHEEERVYGSAEIGGPVRYLYHYSCKFGTPQASTRELARAQIAELMSRVATTLIRHADLGGILAPGPLHAADYSRLIEGANPRLVQRGGYRIYGGEQAFYGEGKLFWLYPVSWYITPAFSPFS